MAESHPTPARGEPLVLVIEDSDATRHAYAALLQLEGFAVEEARNGQEGVSKAIDFLPAIIITDVAMPIMDGWETIRRLKTGERTHHIPIIACSGQDISRQTPDASADAVLAKPISADQLLLEVRALLRRGVA